MKERLPIIDIAEALNRSMGDVDFLKMMLEELHRTIPDYAQRIRSALQAGDMEDLGSEAHQFKGAAANLGAKAMAQEAYNLEKIGKNNTVELADEALKKLEGAIADFNHYFDNINWAAIS